MVYVPFLLSSSPPTDFRHQNYQSERNANALAIIELPRVHSHSHLLHFTLLSTLLAYTNIHRRRRLWLLLPHLHVPTRNLMPLPYLCRSHQETIFRPRHDKNTRHGSPPGVSAKRESEHHGRELRAKPSHDEERADVERRRYVPSWGRISF